MGVCNCSMFCCMLLNVRSSIAITLMGKRELVALLNLSSWCLVMVERLFLAVPRACLQFLIKLTYYFRTPWRNDQNLIEPVTSSIHMMLLRLCLTSRQQLRSSHMETGPRLKVTSDRLVKPGIESSTTGLMASGLSTTPQRLL